MLTTDLRQDFERMLQDEAPELKRVPDTRGIGVEIADIAFKLIVSASAVGAFGGLWKVIQAFLGKHYGCRVKITYKSAGGATVEQEYTNLSAHEVAKRAQEHPPSPDALVLVRVSNQN